jgi:hypothetical protein
MPIGATSRQKLLRYQQTAQSVLNRADSRPADRIRRYAAELAALAPDAIVATGSATVGPFAAGKPFRVAITVPKTKTC